jgi:hypothetical protein
VRICVPVVSIPTTPYETSFDSGDPRLVAGLLTITHGRNRRAPLVTLFDGGGNEVIAPIRALNANAVVVDLSWQTVVGTWYLGVLASMATAYESSFDDADPRLSGSVLTVQHDLGREAPAVVLVDDGGNVHRPVVNKLQADPSNAVEVTLPFPIPSSTTWYVGVV